MDSSVAPRSPSLPENTPRIHRLLCRIKIHIQLYYCFIQTDTFKAEGSSLIDCRLRAMKTFDRYRHKKKLNFHQTISISVLQSHHLIGKSWGQSLLPPVFATWIIICVTAVWTIRQCGLWMHHARRERLLQWSPIVNNLTDIFLSSRWFCFFYNISMPLLFHMATIQQRNNKEARKLPFLQQISQSHVSSLLKINTSLLQQLHFWLFNLLLTVRHYFITWALTTCGLSQCLCFWMH